MKLDIVKYSILVLKMFSARGVQVAQGPLM